LYVNGMSTSLPATIQLEILRSVRGLSDVTMNRAGYAIEYDYYPPTQLDASLQVKSVPGLFFAGQINGTTGYEEAAGQGLLAGLNAVRCLEEQEPLILGRDEAYIGVMIDDLVTKGVDEPYRLLTSRAEYRLHLRWDNADVRLMHIGHKMGLIKPDTFKEFDLYRRQVENLLSQEEHMGSPMEPMGVENWDPFSTFDLEAGPWTPTQVEYQSWVA